MGEKPRHWAATDAAAHLQAIGPAGHVLSPGEVLVEVDACSLWHANLGFAFGDTHIDADAAKAPRSRIAGHVIEAGEDALYFVDRSVAIKGAVPCGEHQPCWTGGALSCPNNSGAGANPHYLVLPARDVSLLGERMSRPTMLGLEPFKDG